MEEGDNTVPSGNVKSSVVLSFQVPKSPLVLFLKSSPGETTKESISFLAQNITDVVDGKDTSKQPSSDFEIERFPAVSTLWFVKELKLEYSVPPNNMCNLPKEGTITASNEKNKGNTE